MFATGSRRSLPPEHVRDRGFERGRRRGRVELKRTANAVVHEVRVHSQRERRRMCPSSLLICTMFLPSSINAEANAWRNAWKPSHGTSASSANGISARRRFSGLSTVPTCEVDTSSWRGSVRARCSSPPSRLART